MIPLNVLDSITIPVACPVPWEAMRGDHRTRFCDQCSQNVHDVSELTREEAVALVTGGKKPCLRLYRRPDGRVMTSDCLTKRERVWKWLNRRSAWAAAAFALLFTGCWERQGEATMGDPCWSEPPTFAHESEQTGRTNPPGDHTASVSTMNAEAKAEAPVRQETRAQE